MPTKTPQLIQLRIYKPSEEDKAMKAVKNYYIKKTGNPHWSSQKTFVRLLMEKYAEISKDLI